MWYTNLKINWKESNENLPSPFLIGLDGQSENPFEGEDEQRYGEVPVGRIRFDGRHSPNGYEAVAGKNKPGQDGLKHVHHYAHRSDWSLMITGKVNTNFFVIWFLI